MIRLIAPCARQRIAADPGSSKSFDQCTGVLPRSSENSYPSALGATGLGAYVSDQGPGIPGDKLETVFKRFFTDRHESFGKHSGLGLSIVQRIVTVAGGRIHAENRDDLSGQTLSGQTGAKFIVDFPLA